MNSTIGLIQDIYLELIIRGKQDVNFAVQTDSIKARLRNELAILSGLDAETIQNSYEELALKKINK